MQPDDKPLMKSGPVVVREASFDVRARKKSVGVNQMKEIFMTGLDGKQNYDAIQDTELPAHIEKGILACL